MPKNPLEALENTRLTRRGALKGLLVGLGAGVLVQANGGVVAHAWPGQEKGTDQKAKGEIKKDAQKIEKASDIKKENLKVDAGKTEAHAHKEGSKAKNEKKKTEEPKNQHKK